MIEAGVAQRLSDTIGPLTTGTMLGSESIAEAVRQSWPRSLWPRRRRKTAFGLTRASVSADVRAGPSICISHEAYRPMLHGSERQVVQQLGAPEDNSERSAFEAT